MVVVNEKWTREVWKSSTSATEARLLSGFAVVDVTAQLVTCAGQGLGLESHVQPFELQAPP